MRLFFCLLLMVGSLASAQSITVLTHDSFTISQEVIDTFIGESGINVDFIEGGDAGEALNRAILTKNNPIADLMFGVDNNLIVRAAEEDLFLPYQSPLLADVPERLIFSDLVTPIDVGYVNFNYDKSWFADNDMEIPQDISALTDERYEGLAVVTNPASSSPGLAFMLTTIDRFGDDWLEYWADLRDNDLLVTDGWSDAYYTTFTQYGGDRPIVLSYATSPAAEVVFAEQALDDSPTGNLFCEACVYRQIEAVGILRGTDNEAAAQQFVDYMLSVSFQEDIPLNMYVYPVNENAALPSVFDEYAATPDETQVATVPSEEVDANLEAWLDAWTQVVQQGRAPEDVR